MTLPSADKAFGIIAEQRKIVPKDVLAAEEKVLEEKLANGLQVTLAQHLLTIGKLDRNQKADIEKIRAKHGRECEACAKTTFLLPGETPAKKPCEFCGGKLKAAAAAPAPAAKPAAPAPAAKPAAPPPTPRPATVSPTPSSGAKGMDAALDEANRNERERNERLRKLRQGSAFGYEPPPAAEAAPGPAPPPSDLPAAAPSEPTPAEDDPAPAFSKPRGAPTFLPPELAVPQAPVIPDLSFKDEAIAVLSFPFKPQIVGVITIGAVVGAILGVFNGLISLLILLYYNAWQVKVTNHVTAGKTDTIPDWPDVGEIGGVGGRLFLCDIACFVPLVLCLLLPLALPSGHREVSERDRHLSVGDDQVQLSGAGKNVIGNDVSDEEFLDAEDLRVRISDFKGKWVVLGLIDKDDADDQRIHRGISTYEVFDLDRLARADHDCAVVGVLVDPGQRRMKALGLIKDDSAPEPMREGDDEVPERTKLPPELNPDAIHGKDLGAPDALRKMKIVRTTEFSMPEKLGGGAFVPTVWIIDPAGKVRLQYDGGASDHVLYGALCDLRKGGNGAASPKALPGEPSKSMNWGFAAGLGFWAMLASLAYLFAAFYHPMAFLMTVVFTNGFLPFNYAAGIGSIARTQRDYLKSVSVLMAMGVVGIAITFFVNDVLMLPFPMFVRDVVARVVAWWVLLYSLVVEAFTIGRFYLRNKSVLGWFD